MAKYKRHALKFYVTTSQRDQIASDAKERGYMFVGHYIRDSLLQKHRVLEEKFVELNKKIKLLMENLL